MGVIFSKFRSKPSTKELLEDLEKDIEALEDYKRSTEQQQKRVVGSLIFYSILMYIVGAAVFLMYYFPTTTKDRIIYSVPLLLFPFILFIFKKFLHWYFMQKIKNNEEQLKELRKKKRDLLEYAMETETYKVVKELLEKFDPVSYKKVFEARPAIEAPPPPCPVPLKGSFAEMELRRRNPPSKGGPLPLPAPSPSLTINNVAGPSHVFPIFPGKPPTNPSFPPPFLQRNGQHFVRAQVPPLPRPVLPRERTMMDRLVDYLVGDGPSNRYALICRQCQSHNGMALKEEFEFVAFRCCYCFHWNPPRSQQPSSPRLPLPAPDSPPSIKELTSGSDASASGDETEFSDGEESLSAEDKTRRRSSTGSTQKEVSFQERVSFSSESELQAQLEEDKPYNTLSQNEPKGIITLPEN